MTAITIYKNKNIKWEEPYFCVWKKIYTKNDKETMFEVVKVIWKLYTSKKATACEIMYTIVNGFWKTIEKNWAEVGELLHKEK